MAFRLVSSGGATVDPTVLNMRASGTVRPGALVEFSRTGGAGVYPGSNSSTTTNIFGICLDYAEGAGDTEVKVIPFASGQIWEADVANAVTTAQIGLRHALSGLAANRGIIVHNTATDLGAGNSHTAIFRAVAMINPSSGSGKLLGYFRTQEAPIPTDEATFV